MPAACSTFRLTDRARDAVGHECDRRRAPGHRFGWRWIVREDEEGCIVHRMPTVPAMSDVVRPSSKDECARLIEHALHLDEVFTGLRFEQWIAVFGRA